MSCGFTGRRPIQSSPSFRNLFIKQLTRERVVPIISAGISDLRDDHPTAPYAQRFFEPFKAAASSIGVEAVASPVHDPAEIETIIAAFAREPDNGLIVLPSAFMLTHRDLVATLAARYRLPAIYAFRHYVRSGGLISYGNIPADAYRQATTYIDLILRGAKPADLPVQAPVKFELVVNLKTAKAMGLTIPESFLLRADEVIE
jgi:putative ABC transport system substrate-binding protein